MTAALSDSELRGSFTPLVTPLVNGEVDYDQFEVLVENQVTGGSQGVVVAGTSGEPSLLTLHERRRLLEAGVRAAAGRIPVVAATGCQSLVDTLELTTAAERAGAAAVLVVTPYYSRPPQRGLIDYFQAVAANTILPLLIYHIPGRAAVDMKVETVQAISDRAPNLVGMKHAAVDFAYAGQVMRRFGPSFRLFVGLEELSLPMLAIGAAGIMNAVGNIAPQRVAQLCAAVAKGDLIEARRINDGLALLNEAVFYDTNPIPIKYMMKRLGVLADNEHRLPMSRATPELERRLDAVLAELGLLTNADAPG